MTFAEIAAELRAHDFPVLDLASPEAMRANVIHIQVNYFLQSGMPIAPDAWPLYQELAAILDEPAPVAAVGVLLAIAQR